MAGALHRLQTPEAQDRLVENIAGGLGAVTPGPIGDGIVEHSIADFRAADPEFGERLPGRHGAPGVDEGTAAATTETAATANILPLSERLIICGWRIIPQRRAVIGALGGEQVHLSAEDVHAAARQTVPEVGWAPVYNTLNELVRLGESVRSIWPMALLAATRRPIPSAIIWCARNAVSCSTSSRSVSLAFRWCQHSAFGMSVEAVEVVFRGRCRACAERGAVQALTAPGA